MAVNYLYAQSAELIEILQNKVPLLTAKDELFDEMPIRSVPASQVVWEQRGNYTGLMAGRTLDGGFQNHIQEEDGVFTASPGYFGHQMTITEKMLTLSKELGTFGNQLNLTAAQGRHQDWLLGMAIDRIRKIGWDLLSLGKYSVPGPNGTVVATGQFATTPFNVATVWSNFSASTPLLDLRNARLLHRGQSASFGAKAKLYLQSQDVSNLLSNTNPNDLGAKRVITVNAGAQPMTLADVNRYLLEADLPQIVEYDKFWIDDTNTPQQFLAQGYGVLIGARDMGDPVAEFQMTYNPAVNVQGVQKESAIANLYYDFELEKNPIRGISTMSFNGAPAFYFPSAIVPFRC